jgi:hypothetical protein
MSREYCRKTPVSKMGFSQKASCKAQCLISRTSRKNKGKLVKSPKYKRDGSLYENRTAKKKKPYFTGYGSAEKARKMIRSIKRLPQGKQNQLVNSMYNRAKFHANQTNGMRSAMKVFRSWLKS